MLRLPTLLCLLALTACSYLHQAAYVAYAGPYLKVKKLSGGLVGTPREVTWQTVEAQRSYVVIGIAGDFGRAPLMLHEADPADFTRADACATGYGSATLPRSNTNKLHYKIYEVEAAPYRLWSEVGKREDNFFTVAAGQIVYLGDYHAGLNEVGQTPEAVLQKMDTLGIARDRFVKAEFFMPKAYRGERMCLS